MAEEFCQWKGGHLPTEAQWEKAARGGCGIVAPESCGPEDERRFPWGNEDPSCERSNDSYDRCLPYMLTTEVGSYPPGMRPYGFCDMSGNVQEWVYDWFSEDYYSTGGPPWIDPQGPESGENKIFRGGSYGTSGCRNYVMKRNDADPDRIYNDGGFRCAAEPVQ